MPPIRTLSIPKPAKTERTHEENQERAYIAASRRSDRSLEARIESARRASEIHKRRTGRSLRVTEADVVNEEMYEEEDDDLPLQYRRLTAHLNGNSSDFNRRLAAYLTNSVAMRSALDQAMQAYPSQYPQPWQQQSQYRPWAPEQQHITMYQNQPQSQQSGMMAPQMMHVSSTNYRQSPYPVTGNQNFTPQMPPPRSASIAVPPSGQRSPSGEQANAAPKQPSLLDRRLSMPAHASASSSMNTQPGTNPQIHHRANSATSLPTAAAQSGEEAIDCKASSASPAHDAATEKSSQPQQKATASQQPSNVQSQYGYMPTPAWSPSHQSVSFSPLTTTLPNEAQMFLGSNFDIDNFTGSPNSLQDKPQMPTYSYNPNLSTKLRKNSGMEQTLAPSALFDGKFEKQSWATPTSAISDTVTSPSTHTGYTFDSESSSTFDTYKPLNFSDFGTNTSGQMTPSDSEWANFIDPASWEESTT